MATDTESMHENMTRLRMRMVQQKLANERERLQRPESEPSENDYEGQVKLKNAMLKRQELLDRIKNEQLDDRRPRTYTPRRRYTPSPLPPPSRRSLPDFSNKHYHFVNGGRNRDMAQVKHVIEHQFRPAPQQSYQLPPIQTQPMPQMTAMPMQPMTPAIMPIQTIQTMPAFQPMQALQAAPAPEEKKGMFNKGDLMEMMMMQNAQMHHMVMQQMMLSNLPGGGGGGGFRGHAVPYAAEPLVPMVRQAPSVYHHHIQNQPAQYMPPMDYRRGFGSGPPARTLNRRPNRGRPYASKATAVVRTDNRASRPSSVFLFGIILKEIVAALHRIYLNPNGNIYPVLIDIIGPNAQDLTSLLTYRPRDQRDRDDPRPKMFQALQYVVENLIYHMTEIMPKTGVLGTHRKSAVFEMIKSTKRFPDGYFWQIELDRLEFDGGGRTSNVGNLEAFILLVGIFLSRSMITTLLLRPIDYGLSTEALTETAERNIKVLASCLLFIVRRVSTKRDSPMLPMPGEVARYVFADEEMKPVHIRLKKTYEYCENLLREWGAEYIKRLRLAANAANNNTTNK